MGEPAGDQAGFLALAADLPAVLASSAAFSGIRIAVEQPLHRTVLPRALEGTPNTLRQSRLGHMMRMVSSIGSHSPYRSLIGLSRGLDEAECRGCSPGSGRAFGSCGLSRDRRTYRTPLSLLVAGRRSAACFGESVPHAWCRGNRIDD